MSVEVAHFIAEIKIVFFVSGFLRGVGCEDQALLDLLFFPILFQEVKGATYPMGFIEMVYLGVKTQNIDQGGSTDSQKHHLSNFGRGI